MTEEKVNQLEQKIELLQAKSEFLQNQILNLFYIIRQLYNKDTENELAG